MIIVVIIYLHGAFIININKYLINNLNKNCFDYYGKDNLENREWRTGTYEV